MEKSKDVFRLRAQKYIYQPSSCISTFILGVFDKIWQSQQSKQLACQGDKGTALPVGATTPNKTMLFALMWLDIALVTAAVGLFMNQAQLQLAGHGGVKPSFCRGSPCTLYSVTHWLWKYSNARQSLRDGGLCAALSARKIKIPGAFFLASLITFSSWRSKAQRGFSQKLRPLCTKYCYTQQQKGNP